MRNHRLAQAAALALFLATSSHAAEKPRAAQQNSTQPKKVWTNDDMDELRARGLISIVGQETPPAPAPAAPAATEAAAPVFPVYASRLDDPSWYAEQAADWQAELDRRLADLQQQQEALALAKNRVTQPGVAIDKPSLGVTPDAAIALLEAAVDDAQSQLDALADLARQHDIPPGTLRS
jgi:hypothetical protein